MWIKAFLFVLGFCAVSWLCRHETDGFTVGSIDRLPDGTSNESKPAISRFSQPFHYLGQGGQSYVFGGEDGKTVLKFFKKNHIFDDALLHWLDKTFPLLLPIRQKYLQTRRERLHTIFSSCRIADERLRSETGLLYLHLQPTKRELPSVEIIDRLGISHWIDLNKASFLLQEKADLLLPSIENLIDAGDTNGAKEAIFATFALLDAIARKGVRDTDNALKRNYGLINGKAICIDTGSLIIAPHLQDSQERKKELFRKTKRLRKLLKKKAPELLEDYQDAISSL